jgi:hypothetical protein
VKLQSDAVQQLQGKEEHENGGRKTLKSHYSDLLQNPGMPCSAYHYQSQVVAAA